MNRSDAKLSNLIRDCILFWKNPPTECDHIDGSDYIAALREIREDLRGGDGPGVREALKSLGEEVVGPEIMVFIAKEERAAQEALEVSGEAEPWQIAENAKWAASEARE